MLQVKRMTFLIFVGILITSCSTHIKLCKNNFTDSFKASDTISICDYCKEASLKALEESMVLKYLCCTQNECLKNPKNDYPLLYYPISRVEHDEFLLLSYYCTDGYQSDVFIVSYSKQNNYVISKLHVAEYIGINEKSNYNLYSKIDSKKDIITISKLSQIEVDSTIELKEVYRLDAEFTLLSHSPKKFPVPQLRNEK